eukprot:1411077-Rhodomonas_salina.1
MTQISGEGSKSVAESEEGLEKCKQECCARSDCEHYEFSKLHGYGARLNVRLWDVRCALLRYARLRLAAMMCGPEICDVQAISVRDVQYCDGLC